MKNFFSLLMIFALLSCGKKADKEKIVQEENMSIPPYDTIAIDSFSTGATSVDIVRKIRIASQQFQDSLKLAKTKNEEEKLAKNMKEDQVAAERKAAEEKKKLDAAKIKTVVPPVEVKKEAPKNP